MHELSPYMPVLPEVIVALGAMAILMLGAFSRPSQGRDFVTSVLAVLVIVVAAAFVVADPSQRALLFDGAFIDDGFARFKKQLVLAGAGLVLIMSFGDL